MSSNKEGAPLNDKLLAKIAAHLNEDHLDDMLACAKAMGNLDWAEQATVVGLDGAGINLEVSSSDKKQSLRLEFSTHARGVLTLSQRLKEMIAESRAQLGWDAKKESD
jgi:putative heme iron utilization protein